MRFRLKTEFLTFAHGQIRGGLWYKPTWWEAVQKVPPTAVLPRLKKKYIPRIRFVEDKLMREFTARNPSLRTLDERNFARGRTSSVAAQFVDEQLRHMRADKSEAASFDVASTWLVENGKRVLRTVDPALAGSDAHGSKGAGAMPPLDAFAKVMAAQTSLLKAALKEEEALRQGVKERELPPLRTFLSAKEVSAIQGRKDRTGPRMAQLPVGGKYTVYDEDLDGEGVFPTPRRSWKIFNPQDARRRLAIRFDREKQPLAPAVIPESKLNKAADRANLRQINRDQIMTGHPRLFDKLEDWPEGEESEVDEGIPAGAGAGAGASTEAANANANASVVDDEEAKRAIVGELVRGGSNSNNNKAAGAEGAKKGGNGGSNSGDAPLR